MRLDVFLVSSRLLKRRSLAQEFCEKGLVRVNGMDAKSAKEVKAGDVLEITRRNETTTVRVAMLPGAKQVSKDAAATLFEVLSVEKKAEVDPLS
jgi:ribosomal 50S subunit-recycling heat shock protein